MGASNSKSHDSNNNGYSRSNSNSSSLLVIRPTAAAETSGESTGRKSHSTSSSSSSPSLQHRRRMSKIIRLKIGSISNARSKVISAASSGSGSSSPVQALVRTPIKRLFGSSVASYGAGSPLSASQQAKNCGFVCSLEDEIPNEVLLHILQFCPLSDVLRFSGVSRHCRSLIISDQESLLWLSFFMCCQRNLSSDAVVLHSSASNTSSVEEANEESTELIRKNAGQLSLVSDSKLRMMDSVERSEQILQEAQRILSRIRLTQPEETYMSQVQKFMMTTRFDSKVPVDHQELHFSETKLMVRSQRGAHSTNSWETVPMNTTLSINKKRVFSWKVRCDYIEKKMGNSWWIIIGVESTLFPWTKQNHRTDVIGYDTKRGHYGCGLIVGTGEISQGGTRTPIYNQTDPDNEIKQGDWIGMTVRCGKYSTQSISFYHRGREICTRTLKGSHSHSDKFRPCVSLTKRSQVTIGYWDGDLSQL